MRSFIDEIANVYEIDRLDLVEKDILLHKILRKFSEDKLFQKNFLFKGGTCLIKTYLGYYRFSEDIDFTWREQSIFNDISQKEIRRNLSHIIDDMGENLQVISKDLGLDFESDKSKRRYVELGGSNKLVTFKLWYDSEIVGVPSFVKIQINFVEDILYPKKELVLRSLISDRENMELKRLFPREYKGYHETLAMNCYDINEIISEKVRAILTRRGIKARDFVDLYLISRKYGVNISDLNQNIIRKIRFVLDLYEKYNKNLVDKRSLIKSGDLFEWGTEQNLLLVDINDRDFFEFLNELGEQLSDLLDEL